MSCENNSKEVKIAREYKYLLSKIKPLIEQLDKSKDAQLCLLWLSKLDQCSRGEGYERNRLLSELSLQVQNKCLEPPFNSPPPSGSLKHITLRNSIPLRDNLDYSDDMSSELSTETSLRSPFSSFTNRSCGKDHFQTRRMPLMGKLSHNSSNCFRTLKDMKDDHARCFSLQSNYHERVLNDQLLINRYEEIIKTLINQNLKNAEPMNIKSLTASYDSKILDLTSSLKMMEEENNNLKQKLLKNNVPSEKLHELEMRNSELAEKVRQMTTANNFLELKCLGLEKEKDSSTIELSDKLNESEKKVKEMDNHIKAIEKHYEENFWTCKAEHQAEINQLEKKYNCELSVLERMLEEKQNEIETLREQVSTQCLQFESEILRLRHDVLENPGLEKEKRKVKFLKSKLRNLEKLHENLGTVFQSQLEQVIEKKDLVISTLEMKLKSHDCDKVGNALKSGLDNLISEKVCVLEAQYRKLLEESENQAIERRQIDLQKILTLEKQLVDHGVGIQDSSQRAGNPENLKLTGPNQNIACVDYEE